MAYVPKIVLQSQYTMKVILLMRYIVPTGYTDLLTKCHDCAVHKNMLEVTLWCIGNKVVPQAFGKHCRVVTSVVMLG